MLSSIPRRKAYLDSNNNTVLTCLFSPFQEVVLLWACILFHVHHAVFGGELLFMCLNLTHTNTPVHTLELSHCVDSLPISPNLPVLPAVQVHLAWSPSSAPPGTVHPHHDVLLHRPVPRLRPQAPPHRRPGWLRTGSPGGLQHSEYLDLVFTMSP